MSIWIGLLVLVTLVWLTRHIELSRAHKRVVTLRPRDGQGTLPSAPKVSVLVAAKDEEANIGPCVSTWLTQEYADFELIVIDDRSTDRTGQILRDIQRNHPNGSKLRVLTVQELPAGWAGKNNAMRLGIENARGDWLLLSDADCRQTCDQTISAAMNYALREQVDLLSVLPVLDTQTVWERIIQPVAGAVMIYWFNPVKVNDPASKAAYANGAFMLIRKAAYEQVGGHAAVRQQLNEDVHMAALIKQKGLRLRVVQNDGLYLTRMYRNFHEMWRGWSRIFYGCFGSVRRLLISAGFLIVMSLLPWISMIVGWGAVAGIALAGKPPVAPGLAAEAPNVAAGASGEATWWYWVAYASTAAVAAQLSVLARFYRVTRSRVGYVITWPVGAGLCVGMLISAIFKTLGLTATPWRGRLYRQGQGAQASEAATAPQGALAEQTPLTSQAASTLKSAASQAAPASKSPARQEARP
jgi:glycosyltransferase involved in cell wall biosynthesis